MIQFNNVSKIYDSKVTAVTDVNFKVDSGEFVFLIGPSGSGKTTIIKMLIRDEYPSDGKIFFDDSDITRYNRRKVYKLRREIGVIFQDFKLIQDKTAYENVSFAMEAAGKQNKDIKKTVPYVLDIVGLSDRMGAFPRQLSGGEQQRVAIARAISNNPKLLIADEPTGNLDPASAWDIVQILSKINNWGTTILMSTHGTDIVNSLNKRVIQMDKGKVIRDDNKGQYEMTNNFEHRMLETVENEQISTVKKKKRLSVNINSVGEKKQTKEIPEEISFGLKEKNNSEKPYVKPIKPEKIGLLTKLFNKFIPKKNKVSDSITEIKAETSEELIASKTTIDKEPEIQKNKNELFINLARSLDESKKELNINSDIKISDEKAEEIITSKDKTSITKLKLSKQVKKDLKTAGYNFIEEIINDGPQKLSKNIILDPEEIILISREVKNFVESKS